MTSHLPGRSGFNQSTTIRLSMRCTPCLLCGSMLCFHRDDCCGRWRRRHAGRFSGTAAGRVPSGLGLVTTLRVSHRAGERALQLPQGGPSSHAVAPCHVAHCVRPSPPVNAVLTVCYHWSPSPLLESYFKPARGLFQGENARQHSMKEISPTGSRGRHSAVPIMAANTCPNSSAAAQVPLLGNEH